MTDLTEQWKKGELPEETECYVRVNGGIYLGSIRYKNGCHNKKLPYVKSFNGQFITKNVEQVLAPVPSYEEWQEKLEENKHLKHDVGNLGYKIKNQRHEIDNRLKEIEKLKELLKESKVYIENFIEGSTIINDHHISYILLQRIKEVLK